MTDLALFAVACRSQRGRTDRAQLRCVAALLPLVLLLVGCGGGGGGKTTSLLPPTAPPAPARAAWTVLVYLGGDDAILESSAIDDLNEMEAVGSTSLVNVVVQADTLSIPFHGDVLTKRMKIARDADPVSVTSAPLARLGEVDMSDWRELVEFVAWGVEQHPADRYALVLWDHGAQWQGAVYDASAPNPHRAITPFELELALQAIQNRTGIERLDLIGFDACLMAGIEVDASLVPYARYRVASEELEPASGWRYDHWLGALTANPGMDGRALGAAIAATYLASLSPDEASRCTQSVIDLSRVPALESAVDILARTLEGRIATLGFVEFIPSRRASLEWGKQGPYDPATSISLSDLVDKILARTSDASVTAACRDVRAALSPAVVHAEAGSAVASAGGESIYFPNDDAAFIPSYLNTVFAITNSWSSYIASYHVTIATDQTPPALSIASTTPTPPSASAAAPLVVDFTISTPDTHLVSAEVLFPLASGATASLASFELPPASGRFMWDARIPVLTDGATIQYLPIRPVAAGSPVTVASAEVDAPGLYVGPATLYFVDQPGGAPAFVGAFVFNGTSAVQLPLLAGDEIRVHVWIYDPALGDWTPFPQTQPVIVGAPGVAPLVDHVQAPAGTYDVEIVAEDFAGNYGFASVAGVRVP